jgi:hypothetical protein
MRSKMFGGILEGIDFILFRNGSVVLSAGRTWLGVYLGTWGALWLFVFLLGTWDKILTFGRDGVKLLERPYS